MKTLQILFSSILVVFLLTSCEKTIDIELDESTSKIVIEGIVTDQLKALSVKVSKSGSYFNFAEYPKVSGAVVTITDDAGNTFHLIETAQGFYQTDSEIRGVSGRNYYLAVTTEGKTFTSTAKMPEPVSIDSVSFEESTFMSSESDYVVKTYFKDSVKEGDNYRLNFYKNGQLSKDHFLTNDKFTNGNRMTADFYGQKIKKGDSVSVEMYVMDKDVYSYFNTLKHISNGQSSMAAPENPISNISNGALGYFGAFSIASKGIKVE